MRHAPYASEYQSVPAMRDGELLDYFLMRVFETDEVWFLTTAAQPFEREIIIALNGTIKEAMNATSEPQITFPVWPYQRFASDAALDQWQACAPSAISLDHFLYHTLDELIDRDVTVEIMPRGADAGCLIAPQRLQSILEGMIDAGEYRLDG